MAHPLQSEFVQANAAKLTACGIAQTFTPSGGAGQTVTVIKVNPIGDAQAALPAGAIQVWGSIAGSGVSRVPAKNDGFTIDATPYRVFDCRVNEDGDSFLASAVRA